MLVRKQIEKEAFPEDLSSLANDASHFLGYSRLKDHVEKPLATVLCKLQIPVLDTKEVLAYMQEKVLEAAKEYAIRESDDTDRLLTREQCFNGAAIWGVIAFVLGFVSVLCVMGAMGEPHHSDAQGNYAMFVAVFGMCTIGALGRSIYDLTLLKSGRESAHKISTRNAMARFAWTKKSLSNKDEIPPFVIRKAVQIAKELPEAQFSTYSMVEKNIVHPDPFLLVEYHQEFYYIEAWDEPKFEAKMIGE